MSPPAHVIVTFFPFPFADSDDVVSSIAKLSDATISNVYVLSADEYSGFCAVNVGFVISFSSSVIVVSILSFFATSINAPEPIVIVTTPPG